jgi:hypothetical protein
MKYFFTTGVLVLILFVFIGMFFVSFSTKEFVNTIFDTPLQALTLGTVSIEVAIADNQQTRRQGLSNLSFLPDNKGLFFVFKDSDAHGIWMKDMKFPIDIIWLNEQLQVVDIHKNVSPDTYPESFHPKIPSRFALEVEAGFSIKHDIKIGNTFIFESP